MSRDVERYTASTDRPGVTYGPAVGTDGYVLAVTTDDGRVEIVFPERPMYSLWTEVKGVPWPDRDRTSERDRMIRQVVHASNGADEEMLRNALEALGVPEDER